MGSVPKAKPLKYISFMGDSLTNNDSLLIQKTDMVPYQVEKLVGGNCKSINKGVSGNTTSQMLTRISDILSPVPTVAVIYGGINDGGASISTTTTQSNIQSMITQLQAVGCSRIVICNIHNIPSTSGTADATYSSYRTVLQSVATSNNLPFCDYHAVALVNPTDYNSVSNDILHLAPSGLQKLANQLKATLDAQGWTTLLQN